MSEKTKEIIVEKRVKSTIIRRRAKQVDVEEKPQEILVKEGVAEKISVDLKAEDSAKPIASAEVSKDVKKTEAVSDKAAVDKKQPSTPVLKIVEDESEISKKSAKKLSRKQLIDDFEMEMIKRQGGLRKIATLVDLSVKVPKVSDVIDRVERVFEPTRSAKGKKKGLSQKEFKKTEITTPKAIKLVIPIDKTIIVSDFAKKMGVKLSDLVKKMMQMGSMVTANQSVDFDTASVIAHEYGYTVENSSFSEEKYIFHRQADQAKTKSRPPVVTVMGHVDHGKTSILDAIRKTRVTEGEAGGITQQIGAYEVVTPKGKIIFIDTPGHEAFTAMRARGASLTDIVVLVVAADDGVMPQTIEAINHSKEAKVPIIVAINKIDKPEANIDKVKNGLSEKGIVSEEWGGENIFVKVSAKTGEGLDHLLEMILLQAEVLELKADPTLPAVGNIIESKLDKGRGPVATVLVKEGILKIGDFVIAGQYSGRVRALVNDRAHDVKKAGPSEPVELIGLDGVPDPAETLYVIDNEDDAKRITEHRKNKIRSIKSGDQGAMKLEDLFAKVEAGKIEELKIVLKADTQGSLEALNQAVSKIGNEKVKVTVIHDAVGAINESDVMLAHSASAIVVGFNIRPDTKARNLAEVEGVDITGMLKPKFEEEYLGRAEVREIFTISKVGVIAGCTVVDGKLISRTNARLLRNDKVVYEGKMMSLKRFKEDVKEVIKGFECGIGLENFNDLKINDTIETFRLNKIDQYL